MVDLLITQRGSSGGDAAHGRLDTLKCRLAAGGVLEGLEVGPLDLDAPTDFAGAQIPLGVVLAEGGVAAETFDHRILQGKKCFLVF